jgi:hypothetical protein
VPSQANFTKYFHFFSKFIFKPQKEYLMNLKLTVFIAVCMAAALVLGGCLSPLADSDGTITIQLPGAGRSAEELSVDEILPRLSYVITLAGPSSRTVPVGQGKKSVTITAAPGRYVITVTASLPEHDP